MLEQEARTHLLLLLLPTSTPKDDWSCKINFLYLYRKWFLCIQKIEEIDDLDSRTLYIGPYLLGVRSGVWDLSAALRRWERARAQHGVLRELSPLRFSFHPYGWVLFSLFPVTSKMAETKTLLAKTTCTMCERLFTLLKLFRAYLYIVWWFCANYRSHNSNNNPLRKVWVSVSANISFPGCLHAPQAPVCTRLPCWQPHRK